MKTFFKLSGIITFVVALVGFILSLTTTGIIVAPDTFLETKLSGAEATFGTNLFDGAVTAVLAFVFALIALVILCIGVILPILKVKNLDKVAGLLNCIAVICLIVAGVLCFFTKSSFSSANSDVSANLGVAFILGGILYIAICPTIANLIK